MGFKLSGGTEAPFRLSALESASPIDEAAKPLKSALEQTGPEQGRSGHWQYPADSERQWQDDGPSMEERAPGNVDLNVRPSVRMNDNSIATVRSMSFQDDDGSEVLIPTISDDGRVMSQDEAVDQYRKTGKHLGKFDTVEGADAAAQRIHEQQAATHTKTEPARGAGLPEVVVTGTREPKPKERKVLVPGHYEMRGGKGGAVKAWIPPVYDEASWGETLGAIPAQIGGQQQKRSAALEHRIYTEKASSARKQFMQARTLQRLYREWQASNQATLDERDRTNFTEYPGVVEAAKLAGVRPDVFTRDWPDFVNLSEDDRAKLKKDAMNRMERFGQKEREAKGRIHSVNRALGAIRPDVDEWSAKGLAFDALTSAPDLALAAGVTAVAGPGAGAGSIFATTAPTAYADAIDQGATPSQADAYALLYGLAETAPETPVLEVIAKTPAGKKAMQRIMGKWADSTGARLAAAGGYEGLSESVTEALEIGIDAGILNQKTSLPDAFNRIARAGVIGTVVGAGVHGAGEGEGIEKIAERKKTPQQSKPADVAPLSTSPDKAAGEPDEIQLDKVTATAKQYATPEEMTAAEALPGDQKLAKLQEFVDRGIDYSRAAPKPEVAEETRARPDQEAVYEDTVDQDVQRLAKNAKAYAKPEEIEAALAKDTPEARLAALQPLVDRGIDFGSKGRQIEPVADVGDGLEAAVERRQEPRMVGDAKLAGAVSPTRTEAEISQAREETGLHPDHPDFPSTQRRADLEAVRDGKATPEQVARLESQKLVIRNETNVPRLLPAGRRVLAKAAGDVVETKVHGQSIEVNVRPSEAQKEAGNYQKGHVQVDGLNIAIENPKGSMRAWNNADTGESGEKKMPFDYGYIKSTEGADGDAVDVYVGPNEKSKKVFVVNQLKKDGSFDEHKAMLGFNNIEHAKVGYMRNFQPGWKGMGDVVEMTTEEFRQWVKDGDHKSPIQSPSKSAIQFSRSEETDGMRKILAPRGETGMAGEETGKHVADGISKYKSKSGSYRYVYSEGGEALSALQVVSKDGVEGLAANVYTLPKHRRKGLATKLYEAARKDFPQLEHNEHQTEDGKKLVESMTQARKNDAFNKWFGNSKVVDKDGKPLVVFHGTNQEVDSFREERRGMMTQNDSARAGFWFTGSSVVANDYATTAAKRTVASIKQHELKIAALKDLIKRAEKRGDWATYERFMGEWEDLELNAMRDDETGTSIVPVYLALQNPLEVDLEGKSYNITRAMQLVQQAKDGGHDGIIVRNVVDAPTEHTVSDHFMVFEPTQIKSAVGNRGTFSKRDARIHFSKTKKESGLVALHNISEENLVHATRIGGFAVPSIAITRADHGISGFGEITLIGDKGMVDPRGPSKARVFASDVYAERYPEVNYKVVGEPLKKLNKMLEPYLKSGSRAIYGGDEISRPDDLVSNDAFKAWAKANGLETAGFHTLRAKAEEMLRKAGAIERIFKGHDTEGNRRYKPHTLENVVKMLKKSIRAGESYGYGVGTLRAFHTPQFRSLSEIQSKRDKLVSDAEFEPLKKGVEEEFWTIANSLAPYSEYPTDQFGFGDRVVSALGDSRKLGLNAALKEYGFLDVPSDILRDTYAYLDKLRHFPTEYFEAKIPRAVALNEFKAAVVPSNIDPEVLKLLEDAGLTVRKYRKGKEEDRRRQVAKLSQEQGLQFSKSGGKGIDRDRARTIVARVTHGYQTPEIKVYQNTGQLPFHLWQRLHNEGGDMSAIDALYDGERIHIIVGNINSDAHLVDTIYHELVVHYGLRQVMKPEDLEELQDGIWRDMEKAVRDAAHRNGLDVENLEHRRLAAEEVMAYMAGKVIRGEALPEVERTLWEKIVAAVRRFLDAMGISSYFDEAKLAKLILDSNVKLQTDSGAITDRLQQPAVIRSQKAPLWYSPMLREFEDPKLQAIATPDEWLKIITNKIATGKIREAEMRWYDLREWLKNTGVSEMLKAYPKAFTAKDMPKGYEQNFQEHLKFQKWFEDANSPAADSAEGRAILVRRAIDLMGGSDAIPPFSEVKYIIDAPVASQFSEAMRWLPVYYHGLVATFGHDPVARIPKSVILAKLRKDQLTFQVRYPTPDNTEGGNSIDWDDPDGEVSFDEEAARDNAKENLEESDVNKEALQELENEWETLSPDYEFEESDFLAPSDFHRWKDGDGLNRFPDPPFDRVKPETKVKIAKENGLFDTARSRLIDRHVEADRESEYTDGHRSYQGNFTDGADHKWEFSAWGPPGGGKEWSIVVDGESIGGEHVSLDRHFDSRMALRKIRAYIMKRAATDGEGIFEPTYQQYTIPVKQEKYKEKLLVWTNREEAGKSDARPQVVGFSHGHFGDDTDFIAHVRSYVTTTTDGKKILIMDELQSDWHQEIRDAADSSDSLLKKGEAAKKRMEELQHEYATKNLSKVIPDWLRDNSFVNEDRLAKTATTFGSARSMIKEVADDLFDKGPDNSEDRQKLHLIYRQVDGDTSKNKWSSGNEAMRHAGIPEEGSQEYWASLPQDQRDALLDAHRRANGGVIHEDEAKKAIQSIGGIDGIMKYITRKEAESKPGDMPYALSAFSTLKIVADIDIHDPMLNEMNRMTLEFSEAERAIDQANKLEKDPAPPLQRTWPIALFQWAIREAAEQNLDGIAITPGSMHGARWGATTYISKVEVQIYDNMRGDLVSNHIVDDGIKDQWENGGQTEEDPFVVLLNSATRDRLVTKLSRIGGWIGKRAAAAVNDALVDEQKMFGKRKGVVVNSEPDNTIWWPSQFSNDRALKIHHGSMEIYNSILPNQLNGWLKKWKSKFGSAQFQLESPTNRRGSHDATGLGLQRTDDQLKDVFELPTAMLTPELKTEALEKGFPLLFSRKWYQRAKNIANRVVQGGTNFDVPDPSSRSRAWNYLVFKMQDKFVDLFKTQQEAAAWHQVAQLPDQLDAYLQQTLFHGRAEHQVKEHEKQFVEPLIKLIKQSGYEWEDVEDFLYARHAPEANAHLLKINNGNPQFNSGMTDVDAQQVMADLASRGDIRKLNVIGLHVDLMTKWSRDQMVMNGLEDASTIQEWENTYKNYVPLKGWKDQAQDPDVANFFGMPKKGKGFDTGGKLTKQRTGRTSRAATILANIVAQAQATIILSEKAKVGRAFYDFVTQTPSSRLWSVDEVEYMKYVDPNTGLVRQGVNPQYKLADNVIRVKVGGKDFHITLNDEIPQMRRIAEAMKNLSADQIGPILGALHKVNRFLSAINTSLNPEFTVTNALRDVQTALINLNEEDRPLIKTKILADWRKAWWAIRRGEQQSTWIAKNHTAQWAKEWEEFKKEGAKVGWIDHYSSPVELDHKLQKMMGPDGVISWTWHGIKRLGDFVENENLAVENALRLSTYVNLRNAGMSQQRAASYAKNLTVNFNRKGASGTFINSLYLFYNAAVQGTARMYIAAKNPRVRKVMYGIMAAAMARDILNRMLGGDDDDGEPLYDKIPEGEKERNMIFMLPNPYVTPAGEKVSYIKIALPYGYNVIDYMGQKMGKLFDHAFIGNARRYNGAEEASLLVGSMVKAFSPLGDMQSSVGQFIAPTALDPLVQISENKAWHGGKLMPDDYPGQPPSPDSQKFFRSTPAAYKEVAAYMNRISGGTEITPGNVDISPETMQLWAETAGGGLARFMTSAIDAPTKDPSERELRDVPFLRKVLGGIGDRQTQDLFMSHLVEVERAKDEIDAVYEMGIQTPEGQERLQYIQKKYPVASKLIRDAYPNFGDGHGDEDRGRRAVQRALKESITPANPVSADPVRLRGRRRAITTDLKEARREIARLEVRTGLPAKERLEKVAEQKKKIHDLMIEFNKQWNAIEDSVYGERNSGKLLERLGPLINGKSRKEATSALRESGLDKTASLISSLPSTPDRFALEYFRLEAAREPS